MVPKTMNIILMKTQRVRKDGGGGVDWAGAFSTGKELQSLEATWYARKGTGIRIGPGFESWLCRIPPT